MFVNRAARAIRRGFQMVPGNSLLKARPLNDLQCQDCSDKFKVAYYTQRGRYWNSQRKFPGRGTGQSLGSRMQNESRMGPKPQGGPTVLQRTSAGEPPHGHPVCM